MKLTADKAHSGNIEIVTTEGAKVGIFHDGADDSHVKDVEARNTEAERMGIKSRYTFRTV